MQLAVGTANINGSAGLNVVSTLRQASGSSAVLVDTPKLTGAFTLPPAGVAPSGAVYDASSTADTGPSVDEVTNHYIGGSPQVIASSANPSTPFTTFGTSGGDFGNGFAPANYTSSGLPASFTPYYEPIYGDTTTDTSTFIPWGGAPAFDPNGNGTGTLNGTFTSGIRGIPLGLNVFQGVTAGAGAYNLQATIPTGTVGSATVTSNVASVTSTALLPAVTAPVVTFDGAGDASIAYAFPASLVGAYVQAYDETAKVPFTFWVTAPAGTVSINKTYGPGAPYPALVNGQPNVAPIASGDKLQVVVIAFDYNQYALQYNGKLGTSYPQRPTLPAQADVTLSPIVVSAAP